MEATHTSASRRVVVEGLGFPEGPRWHEDRLWLSDIAAEQVVAVRDGRAEPVCEVEGRPSGLGWLPDGTLLVVSMRARRLLALRRGQLGVHADFSQLIDHDANDMVVGGNGWAYIGNFGYGYDEPERGTGVVVVSPDGSARLAPADLYRPNGMAITPDGSTLIVAETRLHRLSALTLGPDGAIATQRIFAELPDDSWADGMCLDAEGAAWVADPLGHRCIRVRQGGEVLDVIDTSPHPCIACVLGGDDRRTLFITESVLIPMEQAAIDRPGLVEAVTVPVPGAGWP